MTTGSIFWLTVVLITNYLGLAKLTAHENFLSTTCNRNYKVCIERNLFYDLCVKVRVVNFEEKSGAKQISNFSWPKLTKNDEIADLIFLFFF